MSSVYRLIIYDPRAFLDPSVSDDVMEASVSEARLHAELDAHREERRCLVAVTTPEEDHLRRKLNAAATASAWLFVPIVVDGQDRVRVGPWVHGRSTACLECFAANGGSVISDVLRLDELQEKEVILTLTSDEPSRPLAGRGGIAARVTSDVMAMLRSSLQRRTARTVWGRVLEYRTLDDAVTVSSWRAVRDPNCRCCSGRTEAWNPEPVNLAGIFQANSILTNCAGPADIIDVDPYTATRTATPQVDGPHGVPRNQSDPEVVIRPLPEVGHLRTQSLEATLLNRRSRRNFSPLPVSLRECAHLLYFSAGVTRWARVRSRSVGLRSAPSGGGLYPLDVYVLVRNVSGLTPGVYRYRPALHDLESVVPRASLAELAVNPPSLGAAAAVFLLAATPARSQIKYRERGYRLVLLEAGHVAQNLHLAAVAQGLRSCCVAGFLDEPARRLVGERDGSGTDVIYLVAVGR